MTNCIGSFPFSTTQEDRFIPIRQEEEGSSFFVQSPKSPYQKVLYKTLGIARCALYFHPQEPLEPLCFRAARRVDQVYRKGALFPARFDRVLDAPGISCNPLFNPLSATPPEVLCGKIAVALGKKSLYLRL